LRKLSAPSGEPELEVRPFRREPSGPLLDEPRPATKLGRVQHPSALSPTDLRALPLFPLPRFTLFPGAVAPLHVFEPRYRALVADALAANGFLALPQLKPGYEPNYHQRPAVYSICGAGRIVEHTRLPDGRYNILVFGIARVRLLDEPESRALYRTARVEQLDDEAAQSDLVVTALRDELHTLCRRLERDLPGTSSLQAVFREAITPGEVADCVASALVADPTERQSLLEELDAGERLERLIAHLHELLRAVSPGKSERGLN
jgi:Lon protease-like protein